MKSATESKTGVRAALARHRADGRGSVTTEFALVALPFFAILFAVIQIGVVYLAENELETAVEKSSRQLLTGAAQQASVSQSQFIATVCSYLPALFTCSGLMVDLQVAPSFASASTSKPSLTYNAQGQVANSWVFNAGAADSILVLRVFYQFPVLPVTFGLNLANLPNGRHLMMATSVFQVEPYGSSGS
jgi:Flp pilus assembly protein TadG